MALRPIRFISAAKGVDSTRNQRNTIVGRKLTAACCDAGNSVAIRPEIGATISQNPMIKKPISTGQRTRLSTLSTRIGDDFLSIRFFKVTFFLTNSLLLAPIISQFGIIAIRQPHSAGQKMCKTHGIAGGAAIAGANIPKPRRSMPMANYQFEGHQTRRSRNGHAKFFRKKANVIILYYKKNKLK